MAPGPEKYVMCPTLYGFSGIFPLGGSAAPACTGFVTAPAEAATAAPTVTPNEFRKSLRLTSPMFAPPSGHQFCTTSRGPCRLSSGAPTFVIHDQRACSSASALGRWLVSRQRPHHRALHLRRSREPVTSSSVPWPLDLRLTHEARASLRPGAPAER